jgi:hypothetical protein
LVSAADPDKLWTLRCDVREALITFMQEKHPTYLVRTRLAVETLPAQPAASQSMLSDGQGDGTSTRSG